jgi:hypothetical protein
MSELYPRVHALIVELLQLDEQDAQLPLPVLINLHRMRLRDPFMNLVHLEWIPNAYSTASLEDETLSVQGIESVLDNLWPDLAHGRAYRRALLTAPAPYGDEDTLWNTRVAAIESIQSLLEEGIETMEAANHDIMYTWLLARAYELTSFDPVVQLYQATLSVEAQLLTLPTLEAELSASAMVRAMVLRLADLTEAEAKRMAPTLTRLMRLLDAARAAVLRARREREGAL